MKTLTIRQLCDKLSIGRTKCWQLTRTAYFPKPIKIDCGVRYIESEVDAWIASLIEQRDTKAAA